MTSRGIWELMGARARKGLTLSWVVLFIFSLLLQYASFAATPQTVLAAHNEGIFELEGNAVDEAAPGDDWDSTNNAADSVFVGMDEEAAAVDVTYFTGGGSKDENDIPDWAITDNSVPDKDELMNAYAAVYQSGGDTWVYFGADRFDNDGTAQIGFWFFQGDVGIANGDFTGEHVDGDVLVLSEYTNGGVVSLICAYEWDGSGGGSNIADAGDCDPATSGSNLNLVAAGAACDVADGTFDICAVTNDAVATAPWDFLNKDDETDFGVGQFFEGGINLTDMFGGDAPCFGGFLAETRSSAETDAQLKDFAFGEFNTCVPPVIETTVSSPTIDLGGSVTDTATFSGTNGDVEGTATFFVCGPTAAAADCAAGTQVGDPVEIVDGSATSASFTPTAGGFYCFRVVYDPADGSDYLAGSHTNDTTECVEVLEADIDVEKVANPAGPVSAGDDIGFDITVSNLGDGTAAGVELTDNLPAGIDWVLGATSGDDDGVECEISGAVGSEVLTCTDDSLAAGDSWSVHVSGTTDAADCGTVSNTASVDTSNDGDDTDTATVTVLCPDVTVDKTPDGGSVNAGDNAVFSITVTNDGPGEAKDVTLDDELPAGYTWTLGGPDAADCEISEGSLHCDFGDLADGESRTVTLTAPTSGSNCETIDNLAEVGASNEADGATGNNTDPGDIEVDCAAIDIEKVADPVGPVNAGDEIGFHVTVTNDGDGTATGVELSDALPGGLDWVLGDVSGDTDGVECSITDGVLTCTDDSMAAGESFSVHVSAATSADVCGTVDNTATVTTANDGSDEASASVDVLCPDIEVVKDPDDGEIVVGQDLVFTITVTNIGDGVAYDVVLVDELPLGFEWTVEGSEGCEIDEELVLFCELGDLEPGASVVLTLTAPTDGSGDDANIPCDEALTHTIPNLAAAIAANEGDDVLGNNEDDAEIDVLCSALGIEKSFTGNSGGIDPDLDVPLAEIGDILDYTLEYTGAGPITNAVITDVLPEGLEYVVGSAEGDANFTFVSYDDATRTLTWTAATLPDPANGTVTYQVEVLEEAPDLAQPLINVATIDSDETEPDSDTKSVAVLAPPLELTPPPTSTLAPQTSAGNPGFALMLVLLGVAGLALGIGFITPVPERARRKG